MSIHQIKLHKRNRKNSRKLLKQVLEEITGFINEKRFDNAFWSDDYLFITQVHKCKLYMKRSYESGSLLVIDGFTEYENKVLTWGIELHKSNDLEDALVWMFDVDNILEDVK